MIYRCSRFDVQLYSIVILFLLRIDVYIYLKIGCNKNCIKQVCDAFGFCIQGCIDGYWGPTCDSLCPVNCKELSCNRNTGQCVTCISGFLGDTCTLLCSSFCYGGFCDKTNGNCTQGCTPGRYGDICDRICSSGCINGTCNQHRGICLGGCQQNWSGDHCDSEYWKLKKKCNNIINIIKDKLANLLGTAKDILKVTVLKYFLSFLFVMDLKIIIFLHKCGGDVDSLTIFQD